MDKITIKPVRWFNRFLHGKAQMLSVILIAMLLQSCQDFSDGRMLKKFVSRFNAAEYGCAAEYIYPGDRPNLKFFASEVGKTAPHSIIKIQDYKTEGEGDSRVMKVKLKWYNSTSALRKYFSEVGYPLSDNDEQELTLSIYQTNDGETLTFPFGVPGISPDSLRSTSINSDKDGNRYTVNIYSSESTKSKKVGTLGDGDIVGEPNNGWFPCYAVNKDGEVTTAYVKDSDKFQTVGATDFYMGLFDSMGLLVALIIIAVICVPLFYMRGFIGSIFDSGGLWGIVICIAILLALLVIVYQLIEKVLFELFIWNLPY